MYGLVFCSPVFFLLRRSWLFRSGSTAAGRSDRQHALWCRPRLTIVGFEIRLKDSSVPHMLGALIGGAIGLGAAYHPSARRCWANLDNGRVVFLRSIILLTLPYLEMANG